MVAFQILLAVFATMRLTRLVITDDIGFWFLRRPALNWSGRGKPWREDLVSGLDCPYCIGWWIGCLVLASLYLVGLGSTGTPAQVWMWITGALALNYLAAHIGSRLGDAGYAQE